MSGWVDSAIVVFNLHRHNKSYYITDLINHLKRKPITGIGIGLPGSSNNLEGIHADMHNMYMQVLVQQGLFGALIGIVLIVAILQQLLARSNQLNRKDYLLLSLMTGSFVAMLGSGFFNHHANNRYLWLTTAAILAISTALKNETTPDSTLESNPEN